MPVAVAMTARVVSLVCHKGAYAGAGAINASSDERTAVYSPANPSAIIACHYLHWTRYHVRAVHCKVYATLEVIAISPWASTQTPTLMTVETPPSCENGLFCCVYVHCVFTLCTSTLCAYTGLVQAGGEQQLLQQKQAPLLRATSRLSRATVIT